VLHFFTAAGLNLASEFDLPGLLPIAPDAGAPDVWVCVGDVADTLENPTAVGPVWQANASQLLLQIPGIARFAVTEGREIRVAPENGQPLEELAIFVVGTMLGILLHQRAHVVLHASAIQVGDKAVLFCGPSGAGKSTIAAALNRLGYAVISDDVCALGFAAGGAPLAYPDGRVLKLWAEATQELGLTPGNPVRGQLMKYYVEPGATRSMPMEIGAIYELCQPRPPRVDGIAAQNVVGAAMLVQRNAYRPLLVRRLGQQARYLEAAARLSVAAGIFTLTRPLDFAQMDTILGQLEEHWSALGLVPGTA